MVRISTHLTVALIGLACFACDSPMEVATEASAHSSDTGSAAPEPVDDEAAAEESERPGTEEADRERGPNPAQTDIYPLPGEGGFAQSAGSEEASGESDDDTLTGELNLNGASRSELQLLPGVGPAIAERIDSYRSKRQFEAVDDIKRVRGIGEATFTDLKPYLTVSGETTLEE